MICGGHLANMQIMSIRRHFLACQYFFFNSAYQITPKNDINPFPHELPVFVNFSGIFPDCRPNSKKALLRKRLSFEPENLFMPYANNNGADQPAHPCSLFSTFVVGYLDSVISLVSIFAIS